MELIKATSSHRGQSSSARGLFFAEQRLLRLLVGERLGIRETIGNRQGGWGPAVGEGGEGRGTPMFCNLTKESFIDIERDGYSLKPRGYSLMHSNNLTLRKKYARTNVLKCYLFVWIWNMDTRCESRAEGDFFLHSRFSLLVVCFCFDSFADRQYDLFLFFVVIKLFPKRYQDPVQA